jgi:hypothetical protein
MRLWKKAAGVAVSASLEPAEGQHFITVTEAVVAKGTASEEPFVGGERWEGDDNDGTP